MIKKLIIPIFLISLVLVVSGCTSTGEVVKKYDSISDQGEPLKQEPAQPEEKVSELKLKMGESAKTSDMTVTVSEVKKADYYVYYNDILEENVVERAPPKKVFVFVEAEVKNIGSRKDYAGGQLFSLKDSEGFRYESEIFYQEDAKLPLLKELYPEERIRGTLLFEIPDSSEELKVLHDFSSFFDPVKLASWEVPEIQLERLSSKRSATIKINEIEYEYYQYIEGSISGIDYTVKNTGSVPIDPTFDVMITYNDNELYNKNDAISLFYENVDAGESLVNSISLYISGLSHGSYNVIVNLRDGNDPTILDTATETMVM